eukprot:m51a1_g5024 putative cysteine proteinase rd19a (874) ;mRNA; f:338564-342835
MRGAAPAAATAIAPLALATLLLLLLPLAARAERVAVVVAHAGDELLFQSPDVLYDLRSGDALLALVLTASSETRLAGVRAAYARACGAPSVWHSRAAVVLGRTVAISELAGRDVALATLRLPDQSVRSLFPGEGGGRRLPAGEGPASYTYQELVDALAVVLSAFSPGVVRTLNYALPLRNAVDHVDNAAAARIALAASGSLIVGPHRLLAYEGHTIGGPGRADNLCARDAADKLDAAQLYLRAATGNSSAAFGDSFPAEWSRRQYVSSRAERSLYWDRETMDGDSGSLSHRDAFTGLRPRAVLFRGFAHVFYSDAAGLRHARQLVAGGWQPWEFVAWPESTGASPSAAVFRDVLHVFYWNSASGCLMHAVSSDGLAFSISVHDGDGPQRGQGHLGAAVGTSSVVLEYAGTLQLFYYDKTNGNLRHSFTGDGSAWVYETLDGCSDGCAANSDVGLSIAATVFVDSLQAAFKETYAKSYATAAEEHRRFELFSQSLRTIEELNARHPAATFAFSDMSDAEWASAFLSQSTGDDEQLLPNATLAQDARRAAVPAEYASPYVTPVRRQGCGDSWAFAAVAALETAWLRANGVGVDLSEQAVRDCSRAGDCGAGSPAAALQSIAEQGGLPEEALYPYNTLGAQLACRGERRTRARLDMWGAISPDESEGGALAEGLVAYGGLAVTLDGSLLRQYAGGVVEPDSRCAGAANSAALLVGYTRDTWVLKASLGPEWGERGYFRLRRGRNTCGVARGWALAARSPELPEDSGHVGTWQACTSSRDCATTEESRRYCRIGDRRCLTDADCDHANAVDHTQRDCRWMGPYHLGMTPRWNGCTTSRECVVGASCHVGDRRCLTDDDCDWANGADHTHRNCSQTAW